MVVDIIMSTINMQILPPMFSKNSASTERKKPLPWPLQLIMLCHYNIEFILSLIFFFSRPLLP